MGWKASTIIINKPIQIHYEDLLKTLGFGNLTKIEDQPFEVAIYPENNRVYIGAYKDNLLICVADLPMELVEKNDTETEKTLNSLFAGSEICSIVLHSAVNLWGYAVIKDGKKIRARAGSADEGTYVESGEPLEEEAALLSKCRTDDNGNRTYFFEEFDEPFTEDQVGENFVFSICKRYFGEELDSADDLLFETILTGYKYGHGSQNTFGQTANNSQNTRSVKPWWKFW